jgi:putative ABC transport system permease protein
MRGERVLQDLRLALRVLARERWFTAVVVTVLALGIGANATVFTIVHAAFLRGLPFPDADRLMLLALESPNGGRSGVSVLEVDDWRAQARSFSGIAAFREGSANISDDRALPEQARTAWLTANAFDVLGQAPLIGRAFMPGDERPGAETVAILGSRLWKNRYGADPAILGRTMRINGQPATVIGVMPDGVRFPVSAELWAPFVPTTAQRARDARPLTVFARLRDGVSVAQARTEMRGLSQRLADAYPATNKDLTGARVETFTERFVGGGARPMFLAMMGAVCFVLLIACANVANLMLARSAARAREAALRMALGATRLRILRQLLIESLVLGGAGALCGLAMAMAAVPVFDASVQDPGKPFWIVFAVDYTVVGYVASVGVLTSLFFGLAPALQLSGTRLNDLLNEGGRASSPGPRVRWLSGAMVVTELALTCVLLVGAGLMVRSLLNAFRLDIGMPTAQLMVMGLELPERRYPTPDSRRAFFDRLTPRLDGVAGIQASAVTTSLPLSGLSWEPFEIEGRTLSPDDRAPSVSRVTISARFFDVASVPILRGRALIGADGAPGAEHIVINQRMAARYFPGEDPVGRRLRFVPGVAEGKAPGVWRTIVGVSGTVWHSSMRGDEASGVIYLPARQDPPQFAYVLVRSALASGAVMDAVRREVQAIDRDQPVFTIQTLDERIAEQRWPLRVFGTLLGIFAGIALALSAVGLYAVMAYAVSARTVEIGVRMALGADARTVRWLVLRRGLVHLAIGLPLGLAGAFAVSRILRRSLVQISAADPLTFAAIAVLLTLVAVTACLVPARRATRIDPLAALRSE